MLKRIAVLVSGGGTNLQALIDARKQGRSPNCGSSLLVSSNSKAYALERARQHGIETAVLPRRKYATTEDYDQALLALMQEHADRPDRARRLHVHSGQHLHQSL